MWDYVLILFMRVSYMYHELVHNKKIKTGTGCTKSNNHYVWFVQKDKTRDILCTSPYTKLYSELQFLHDRIRILRVLRIIGTCTRIPLQYTCRKIGLYFDWIQ